MKKYRLTKITVKTREIISLSKNAAHEIQNSICPICHSPLSASFSADEAELSTAKLSDNQAKQLKGDL